MTMSGPIEKAVGLCVGLLAAIVLFGAMNEKLGALAATSDPVGALDGTAAAAAVAVAVLGFIGRRWIVRRFMEPQAIERRAFTERRRAEPQPPDFRAG